jgi:MscS family membrane protein
MVLGNIYEWIGEMIAIFLLVIVFNFFAKWLLKRLHLRFEKQKKIWEESFVRALYFPLSCYVWFFAIIEAIDLVLYRVVLNSPFANKGLCLTIGAVLAFSWFLMRWKKNLVHYMIAKSKNREITIDPGKIDAINKIATVAIAFFAVLALLQMTNRNATALIAFGGVGGLALAFASQEIIANFFGGLMIYLTHPFTIGDWIHLPERNIEGTVEEIGWYMTRIRSLEKQPIYVPNSLFSKMVMVNPSRMSHRQFKETIGVRYEDKPKIKKVISDIKAMLEQHLEIDHQQAIIVRLAAFGQYSLDILVSAFTSTVDSEGFSRIKEDILFKIFEVLEKNDTELAFPVISIHEPGMPRTVQTQLAP